MKRLSFCLIMLVILMLSISRGLAAVWPISASQTQDTMTSAFGPRDRDETAGFEYDFHEGLDIQADIGTPVYAVKAGVVEANRNYNDGNGIKVRIKHDDGTKAQYCHLDTNLVSLGEEVSEGEEIGLSGNTADGDETVPPHLHFDYKPNGRKIHPLHILPHTPDTGPGGGDDIYIDSLVVYRSPPKVKVFLHVPGTELDLNKIELQIGGPEGYSFSKYADFDLRYNVGEQQTINGVTFWPEDFFVGGDQDLAVEFDVPPFEAPGIYTLQVTAVDVDGVEYQKELEIPVEVDNLHVVAGPGDREITISWDATNPVDHDHFDIYRSANSSYYIKVNPDPITGYGDLAYTDITSVYDISYSYLLVAVDSYGNLAFYTPPETEVIPINGWNPPSPDPPSGLSGTIDGDVVTLSWDAPSSSVSKYHLFRSFRSEQEGGHFWWIGSVPGGTLSYSDSVEEGLAYYYFVEAYDEDEGYSLGQTNEVQVGENTRYFIDIASSVGVADIGAAEGASWADYDGDGDLDLYVSNSGANGWHDVLYRNDGEWFSDVTTASGLDGNTSSGSHFADYDNDGDLDVYLSGVNKLYSNDGTGVFADVTASSGLSGIGSSLAASWGDYDGDGDVDLFVVTSDGEKRLYSNDGDGTFTDVTASAGVGGTLFDGLVYEAIWGDYDGDGDQDIYIVGRTDYGNLLYANNGDGTFSDETNFAGVTNTLTLQDADWVDYDNDGDLDLYLTIASWYDESNILFGNNGDGTFTDVTSGALLSGERGGEACWLDFDTDGDLDLLTWSNLYVNNGNGTFVPLIAGSNGEAVVGDYDGDGDEDVYVLRNGSNELLDNQTDDGSSITVRLEGYSYGGGTTYSNRSGIGSKVRVYRAGETTLSAYREVTGSQGSPLEAVIGVNSLDLWYDVQVVFPSGQVMEELDAAAGQVLTIHERGYLTARNPSFEESRGDQIGYWTPYGTGTFGSSFVEYREGNRSAYLSRTSGSGYFGFRQRYIQVEPSTTYYLGAWVKTQGVTQGAAYAALGVWAEGEANHHVDFGAISGDTDWTYISGSWTSWANEDRIEIKLYGNPDFVGEAWFDGLYLGTEPPPPGPIAVNTTWSGTVHISGDVTVLSGVTLTISPGTEVLFAANSDDQHGGYDPDKCELIVEGTLEADGVTFRSDSGSPANSDWQGIKVASGGSINLINSTVQHAQNGVYLWDTGSVTLRNNEITQCGTGIFFGLGEGTISGNTVWANSWNGIDIIFVRSNSLLDHNLITNNGNDGVEIISSISSFLSMENNTIVGNENDGIYVSSAVPTTIKNNIIVSNGSYGGGYGINGSGASISYNDVWNNSYGDYNNSSPGTGDISQDPQFVDAGGGDYHLRLFSPCIDAGDPASDYNQEPLPNGGRINMGRYGNTLEAAASYEGTVTVFQPGPSDGSDVWLENAWNKNSYDFLILGKHNSFPKKRTLIEIDVSSIPQGATILESRLEAYHYGYNSYGGGTLGDRVVQVHRVLKEWAEGQATQYNRLSGVAWGTPYLGIDDVDAKSTPEASVNIGTSNGWKTFDITGLTQDWVDGTASNYGVLLWTPSEEEPDRCDRRFYSSENSNTSLRPKLVVRYTGGNHPPVAVVGADPTSGTAPLEVQFTGSGSYDPDGTIVSYSWNFGDGGSSTSVNPSHTYTTSGTYTATLTVTDDEGATDSDNVGISVSEPGGTTITLQPGPSDGSDVWLENAWNKNSYDFLILGKTNVYPKKRTLIEIDVASIPQGSTILESSLEVYHYGYNSYGGGTLGDRIVQVHQVLKEWAENQATRDNRLSGVPWGTPYVGIDDVDARSTPEASVNIGTSNGWKTFDITGLTQAWVDGTASNYGVLLWTPSEEEPNRCDRRFYSSENSNASLRPKLVVTYQTGAAKIALGEEALPKTFALLQNRPNPFNPETRIEYHLPKAALVSLKIYNVLGQEIRTLVKGTKAAGVYRIRWDGRDEEGRPVSSGIYLYRMKAKDFVQTKKMLILR